MTKSASPDVAEAAARIVELEAELESAGDASLAEDDLSFMRARLHEWVDSVVGVVNAAGSGRVTLIHADGTRSSIASPQLPYRLSRPARFDQARNT
jgi:hypothetical protein